MHQSQKHTQTNKQIRKQTNEQLKPNSNATRHQELLCKLDGAEAACKAWSATAVLCPEVNEVTWPCHAG